MSKKRKYRAEFRKNHQSTARQKRFDHGAEDTERVERLSGKGRLSRKKTVAGAEIVEDSSGVLVLPEVDPEVCVTGRVLRVQGLVSTVRGDDGVLYACATRQLLKQLATDLRHVVCAGDRVWLRPVGEPKAEGATEGIIERVEPRRGVLSRTSRGRQHLIASNVDQIVVVASAAEPRIKPNLIDRYLLTCEKAEIRPILCINKVDLVERTELAPLVGVYAQLGYEVICVSASTGFGVARLREQLWHKQSALTGQSGVGKSSLLNAVEPGLALRVQTVSGDSHKGRHTTTTAELYPFGQANEGGCVDSFLVDTPGIRSFELWDVIPEEVAGYFRDVRPYVSQCRFPDCTHTHEDFCAVKDAVADGWIDARRYESYVHIHSGE